MLKKMIMVTSVLTVVLFTAMMGFTVERVNAEERQITFNAQDGYTLYGTLTVPEHSPGEKLPAILLVHGSGPNDRDETIDAGGGITLTPFKELAKSLENKGYIVLRYDKRSFTMLQKGYNKEEFDKVMPDHFINDARDALDYLRTVEEVDQDRVILVGHSQGASFVPFIIKDKDVAGAVLLAPGLLPIDQQMTYQIEYQIKYMQQYNQTGQFDQAIAQSQGTLDQLKAVYQMIDDGTFPEGGVIMGAPLPFLQRWIELTANISQKIVETKEPLLIVNGTTDMLCPVELLQEREDWLKGEKTDLQITYIENMVHQLYFIGTMFFVEQVPAEIDQWVKGL